jgi:stage V sporulation protein SpoVS
MSTEPENHIVHPVRSSTNVGMLAGKLMHSYTKTPDRPVHLRFIGAGAGSQATKAVIIFNIFLAKQGKVSTILPYWRVGHWGQQEVRAMEFRLFIQNTNT